MPARIGGVLPPPVRFKITGWVCNMKGDGAKLQKGSTC